MRATSETTRERRERDGGRPRPLDRGDGRRRRVEACRARAEYELPVSYYDVLLAGHIAGVVIWVGGGMALTITGSALRRSATGWRSRGVRAGRLALEPRLHARLAARPRLRDPARDRAVVVRPALDRPRSRRFATTLITGVFLFLPRARATKRAHRREDGMSAEAAAAIREFPAHAHRLRRPLHGRCRHGAEADRRGCLAARGDGRGHSRRPRARRPRPPLARRRSRARDRLAVALGSRKPRRRQWHRGREGPGGARSRATGTTDPW